VARVGYREIALGLCAFLALTLTVPYSARGGLSIGLSDPFPTSFAPRVFPSRSKL